MDLLGDIGHEDQLTAARSENAVLQKRVKELAAQVKILSVEKASLEAEVEIYRAERAANQTAADTTTTGALTAPVNDDPFFQSGNGVYCTKPDIILRDLHGTYNPLCVALDPLNATLLATGGADGAVVLTQWGSVTNAGSIPAPNQARWDCQAPVIAVSLSKNHRLVATGSMDGTVRVLRYSRSAPLSVTCNAVAPLRHSKYVKTVLWWENGTTTTMLVTTAADGDVHLYRVHVDASVDGAEETINVEHFKSLHLGASIETSCLDTSNLYIYARETTYLTVVNLEKDCERSTLALNDTNNCFSDHVSFAVLDMAIHGEYLACATDAHRHVIFHLPSQRQVRNLYGHQADAYSSPVLAWSQNGQYLYCNTQHASSLCVYEVASGKIVQELKEPHQRSIKDVCSTSSMVVTTSFDRQTVLWFANE